MKLMIRKIDYIKGEMHFVLEEFQSTEESTEAENSFSYEIARQISRKQAVEPLVLDRWE